MTAVLIAREPSARYLVPQQPLVRHFELMATAPGGVARLRELILTLAVQGKLVPQDPCDEPASVLLKKIRAEKDRLIAAKALKREKDEPALAEDALPFDLPVSWTWAALGEVIDIVRGITFPATQKTREAAPGRIACLRTSNVQQIIEWEDLLFVDRSFMGREDQLIQHHDIVMSMANSRELVGKVALIDHIPHAEATFGGFLGVLRPRKIGPRYAMAVLRTPYARSLLIDSSSQTTNIANVSLAKLRPLPFPLPPEAEQSRIVIRVEELMRLCDALEAKGQLEATQHTQLVSTLLGTLTDSETPAQLAENWHRIATHFDLLLDRPQAVDALEQTILQLAVRGLLVPQDPQDEPASQFVQRLSNESMDGKPLDQRDMEGPFVIPSNWCWVSLQNLARSMSNGLYKPAKFYSETGTACVRMYNIQDGHLDFSKLMRLDVTPSELAQYSLEPGDLLINRVNSRELVGKCAVVSAHHEPLVYEAMNIRVRLLESVNMPSYVNLVLRTKRVRELFQGDAKQAVGQASINQTQVGGVAIPLPPLAEQSRIVTCVTSLRRLCADLRQRLTASQSTQAHLAEALVQDVAQS